jgi:hypothetical protein|nr:MAG TPA_asm: hypothetical protein [Caudoviricetes sp.]
MNITLDDGRTELWQWDTGRKIVVDDDSVSEVHFSKYSSNRAIAREVVNRKAEIPDFLLQDTHTVTVYAYSGSIESGYTKAEKTFSISKKPKPSDYVATAADQAILAKLKAEIGDLSALQTDAKDNLVTAINEAAASGGADWNQNDPTAKDYVRNRTHWVETQYEEKYANNDAPFADNGYGFIAFTPDSVTWDIVAGDNYSVVFDGIEYRCVCNSASYYGSTWLWAGNANLGAPYNNFASDTGEPFLITASGIFAKSAGNHAIQISRVDLDIHRLSAVFMDLDAVYTKLSNLQNNINVLFSSVNEARDGTDLIYKTILIPDIAVGTTYSVNVERVSNISQTNPVKGRAYIEARGHIKAKLQTVYLNPTPLSSIYTGVFCALDESQSSVERVYSVYVNLSGTAIAKFTRIV